MKNVIRSVLIASISFSLRSIADDFDASTNAVGHVAGGLITPANQLVTPAGTLVELPGMRPQALALSPDGKILVTAGLTHELMVLDPATGKNLQHVAFPSDKAQEKAAISAEILSPDGNAQLSFTGLAFSPDGSLVYFSEVYGGLEMKRGGEG